MAAIRIQANKARRVKNLGRRVMRESDCFHFVARTSTANGIIQAMILSDTSVTSEVMNQQKTVTKNIMSIVFSFLLNRSKIKMMQAGKTAPRNMILLIQPARGEIIV
jgi:hypothetical protein